MATEAQKKQFVKGCIIFSFQVYDEDDRNVPEYHILSTLYDSANLNNNKALVNRLEQARNIAGRIYNAVYLDIAYIVADKIVEDTTGFLKDMYVSMFAVKYPYIKRIVDNAKATDDVRVLLGKVSKESERQILVAFLSFKYDLDEMESLAELASMTQYYSDIFIDDNMCMDKRTMVLPDGTNIIETGAFEKYKARRIGEICEYLGIEEPQFRAYFVEEMKIVDGVHSTPITASNGSFEHLLTGRTISNHKGGIAWATNLYAYNRAGRRCKPYEPDIDDVINAYFSALFLQCRSDKSKGEGRVAMMREYKSESPETDWRGLCHAYQQDRLVKMMMLMQKKYYEDFSWEHTSHKDIVAKYEKVIAKMQSASEEQAKKMQKLQDEVDTIQMREHSISNENYHLYEQKIKQLQKQLEEKDREIDRLKKQSADKDEYIELLETEEDELPEVIEDIDYEALSKRKILFVGGLPETVNKVLSYFSFKKHIGKTYSGTVDVSAVNDIVIFYDFINHALYYKVINVAREHKLNVIYCHGRNAERIVAHIADNLSEGK